MVAIGKQRQEDVADPMLTRLLDDDDTPWYRKRNLRSLYLVILPAAMGIEITSGFDSQIINTVQIVPSWNKCAISFLISLIREFADEDVVRLWRTNRQNQEWCPRIPN